MAQRDGYVDCPRCGKTTRPARKATSRRITCGPCEVCGYVGGRAGLRGDQAAKYAAKVEALGMHQTDLIHGGDLGRPA